MSDNQNARLPGGGEMGRRYRSADWTETSLGNTAGWPHSLLAGLNIVLSLPIPAALFWGPEAACLYNDAFQKAFIRSGTSVAAAGSPAAAAIPELWDQISHHIYPALHSQADAVNFFEPLRFHFGNHIRTLSASFVSDNDGRNGGVLATFVETDFADAQRAKLEESEARMKAVITSAPIAIAILAGPDHRIQLPNQAFKDVLSKGDNVEDRPLGEVLPELAGEGQPFLDVLNQVFETGEAFRADAAPARIMRNGELITEYFNITFSPLYDAAGQIYGILDISVNVTETVLALQRVEANEQTLATAIQLAELGTWSLDAATGEMTYSERLQDWLGVRSAVLSPDAPPQVHELDRQRIAASLANAMKPGGSGKFDEIYTITHAGTGQLRVIHAIGRASSDEDGRVLKLAGTAQDITLQRDQQAALEHQVQNRTEELAAAVEELRATNEELGITNDELHRSNDELAQYAYVASHDLQEPLRKIRVFSGMLAADPELPESVATTIGKISGAAGRMSQLIQDLLAFSKLLKSESLMGPVALTEVATAVWSDFDLIAEEKDAEIQIDSLPVIQAVKLQMNQLFYNLLSNALKFTSPDRKPKLVISARELSADELRRYIPKPLAFTGYYDISVSDNGIGFETQYNEQIFEVFKRLHTREMYPGSGIGLALCRRIAVNHGGFLYAVSEVGKGSTFHVVLPERQWDEISQYEGRAIEYPDGD
jgi:signal transduction histidine kinase